LFIKNCIRYYEPGYNVTINEYHLDTLFTSDGIYHKNECKIKILVMNDSDTFYMINAIPRIINIETEPLNSYYITKISEPIHKTYRNITCCNKWLVSVSLVENMLTKFLTTIVGPLKKDEFYIPPSFKKALAERICQVAFQNNKILVSYKSENDKMILLLSSLHSTRKINNSENKPKIISYYNKTKGASNKFVQLCHEYAIKEKANNLAIRTFYGMLDQAAVNSFVLYTLNVNNKVITREQFLLELSMTLIKPFLIQRLSQPAIKLPVKFNIKNFLNEQDLKEIQDLHNLRLDISNVLSHTVKCSFCWFFNWQTKTTRQKCLLCQISMCATHKSKICQSCAENQIRN